MPIWAAQTLCCMHEAALACAEQAGSCLHLLQPLPANAADRWELPAAAAAFCRCCRLSASAGALPSAPLVCLQDENNLITHQVGAHTSSSKPPFAKHPAV